MRSTLWPAVAVLLLWGVWPLLAKVSVTRLGSAALLWSYVAGMGVVALYLAATQRPWMAVDSVGLLASLASGAVVAVGSLIFYQLLHRNPTALVTFLTGLYPLVSLLLAWVVFGERPSPQQSVGMALAVGAIVLLTR
jgi:drug/metabolite transporter (DMT)-like permease